MAIDPTTTATPLQLTVPAVPQKAENTSGSGNFWSGETPSFGDFLDTINPLQHIPIVSGIYQFLTGDTQSTGSKIAGGALFGGPIGLIASIFDTIIQNNTGTDVSGNILAAIEGKPVPALETKSGETQVAENTIPDHLSANQRAGYNAYVNASMLA